MAEEIQQGKLEGGSYAHCSTCVTNHNRAGKIEVLLVPDRIQLWCATCDKEIATLTLAYPFPAKRVVASLGDRAREVQTWWISLADRSGFLGALLVRSSTFEGAVEAAIAGPAKAIIEAHPEAEACGYAAGRRTDDELKPYTTNRIYSKAEIEAMDGAVPMRDLNDDAQ